jgi:hypothetical protein
MKLPQKSGHRCNRCEQISSETLRSTEIRLTRTICSDLHARIGQEVKQYYIDWSDMSDLILFQVLCESISSSQLGRMSLPLSHAAKQLSAAILQKWGNE